MLNKALIITTLILLTGGFLSAQGIVDQSAIMDSYNSMQDFLQQKTMKEGYDEENIEKVEAYFLEKVFLKEIFDMTNFSLLTEDERKSMMPQFNNDVYNNMIIKALAEKLAKQDVLGLKKQLLPQVKAQSQVQSLKMR